MLFNSIDFLIFFPAVLLVYFIVPHRIRPTWLLLSSYYFYMSWNPVHGILLLAVTAVTYLGARLLQRMDCEQEKKKRNKKIILVAEVIAVIGMLGYFKYTGFFLDSINVVLAKFCIAPVEIEWNIALPIGISFYTLTALGYLIDVYRGKAEAEHNFLRYALFVSFFPQILSGPIERSTNLLRQLRDSSIKRNWNTERIASGFITMLWGFFLKLVIADRIAVIADTTFGRPECYGTFGLVLGAVSYGIQIYCDFSSYSLIALGAAKTLGFDLINNFETPYFAQSVTEFWHRWHISLSTWLRDYVYISMGGNRCSKWRQYWNILVTFMVSGLWHGANWTFFIWGALHGIYQILEKELRPVIRKINGYCHTKTASFGYRFAKAAVTFALVDFAWIFFRADSVKQALHYVKRMISFCDMWSLFYGSLYTMGLDVQEIHILMIGLTGLIVVDCLQYLKQKKIAELLMGQWCVFRWAILICLIVSCIVFGYYGQGFESANFIYLQF